jgi:hypothetical protein
MIELAAARSLVKAELDAMPVEAGDEWLLLDDATIEKDWGWVFLYNSRLFHETGDFRYAVAGNAPFFVRRHDGAVFVAGTAYPIEEYIRDFEQGGPLTCRCC